MFLCEAVALVAGVWQILLPELGISAAIDLPVDILGLQHKYAISGDNDMVDLRGVIPVTNQKVIVNPVVSAVQILQEGGDSFLAIITNRLCPAAILGSKQRCPESFFLLYSRFFLRNCSRLMLSMIDLTIR